MSTERDQLADLTKRQLEVLTLMSEGLSNYGIANKLSISPRAVEKHITEIFCKLGLVFNAEDHRRVKAVLLFLRIQKEQEGVSRKEQAESIASRLSLRNGNTVHTIDH